MMRRIYNFAALAAGLGLVGACGTDPVSTPPVITDPLQISSVTSLAAGRVGVEYSALIAAEGGDATAYTWNVKSGELPDGLMLSTVGSPARLTGTPGTEGSYVFTVSVKDAAGASAERGFTLDILPEEPDPLSIVTMDLPRAVEGAMYTATLTADGASGEGHAWALATGTLPDGLTLARDGSPSTTISGTPSAAGSFTFTVRVTDASRQRAERSFTIEVAPPPVELSVVTPAELFRGTLGSAYIADLQAMGGSGAGYTWALSVGALPAGLTLSTEGELSGTPTLAGDFAFTVMVTDSARATAERALTLTIEPVGPPLRILTTALSDARVGEAYALEIRGTGGVGSDYMWSVSQGSLPGGLMLGSTGTPSTQLDGTPAEDGDFTFTVVLTDALGQVGELEFTLHVDPAIVPIHVVTATIPDARVGDAYEATLTAADGFGRYNWLVTGGALPDGLDLELSGTPSARITGSPIEAGTFTATVTVFDLNNVSASRAFTIVVARPLNPVTILTTTLPNAGLGAPYSEVIEAANGSEADYVWSISQGALPPGLTLDPTGTPSTMLSGTPSASGSYTFTVRVADSANGVATQAFTVSVGNALSIETTSVPRATFGQTYTATIVADGGTSAGYSWSISQGALPTGLTLRTTGTPATVISGSPTQFGSRTVEVEVTDSGNNVARVSFTISVLGPQRYVAWVGDSNVDNDTSVFVVDISAAPSFGAPIQVSPLAPGTGDSPTSSLYTQWSPDNTKIAFRGDYANDGVEDLWVVDLSGPSPLAAQQVSGPLIAAGDVTYFEWSPDSRWLAYQADQDVDAVTELYLVDVTGAVPSTPIKVNGAMVSGGDVGLDDFGFSPDSSWLYYNADQEVDNSFYQYVVDLSAPTIGLGVRVHPDLLSASADVSASGTFFSPDGNRMYYVADQETVDVDEMWMVDLSTRVPGTPVRISGPLVTNGDVVAADTALSPDGQWMAFVADAETDAVSELWVVDLRTTPVSLPVKVSGTLVTNGDVTVITWSPDGTRLLYLADQDTDTSNELYVVGVGGALPLTATKVNAPLPPTSLVVASLTTGFMWSPDGSWIGYRADPVIDGSYHMFVVPMSAAGPGAAVQLSEHSASASDIESFGFSPDGNVIAFRGDDVMASRDDLYVSDLSSGTPAPRVAVAVPTVTNGNVLDFAFVGNGRLLVRADLDFDNVFSAYLVDVASGTPIVLHGPIPTNGDVSSIFEPF